MVSFSLLLLSLPLPTLLISLSFYISNSYYHSFLSISPVSSLSSLVNILLPANYGQIKWKSCLRSLNLVGWLWHINLCGLFKSKFCLYKYQSAGAVECTNCISSDG